MKRLSRPALFLIALFFCASCAPVRVRYDGSPYDDGSSIGAAALPKATVASENVPSSSEIDKILDRPGAAGVFWGISVKSLGTGQRLFSRNENKLFVPASNMKLFTTAVALIRLGPDFTYTTSLYSKGGMEGEALLGDIYLRGSGDPTISGKFQGRPTAVFEEWADRLKQQGIREIRGDLVGDDTLFDEKNLGAGWAWDDELIAFSARISAISFNDNCFDAVVSPGIRPGDPARIHTTPETSYIRIANNVKTVVPGDKTELSAMGPPGSKGLTLSGRIEAGSSPRRLRFPVENPTLYAMTVLKEVLADKGIRVTGVVREIRDIGKPPDYGAMKVLVTRRSAPLREIIEQTNKHSQNLYAELLFRTLGAVYGGKGTTEKSVQAMVDSLEGMGIRGNSLAIYDGSGLSRLDLVTPSQIVTLLDYMYHHPYFDYFYRSLPLAGVDGTLMKRMKNTEAQSNVRAKTGTLTHAAALSGYMKRRDGSLLAFSIMSNNSLSSAEEVRSLQDALCVNLPLLGHPSR